MAGLVLAAGRSSRMEHRCKVLMPYGEGTVVGAVVRAARDGGLEPVLVVVGHRSDEVRDALGGSEARTVENPEYRAGMASSLAAGVRALTEESRAADVVAAAVLLGDEPGIRSRTIRAAVSAWRRTETPVLRTRYRDRPGHPVLFGREAFPVLARLSGDRGPAELLASGRSEVAWLEVDGPAPVDVDTPASYREALDARDAG